MSIYREKSNVLLDITSIKMYNIYRVKEKGGKADMKNKKEELIALTALINLVTAIVLLVKAINS